MTGRVLRFGGLLAAVILTGAGCRMAAQADASTIVLSPDEQTLYISSPDDAAVVAVDATTLEELSRWGIGGEPALMGWDPSGRLVVTLSAAAAVTRLDPATGAWSRHDVPCGRTYGLALLADGRAFVSCPDDNRVLALDEALSVVADVDLDRGPSALVVQGGELWVARSRGGGLSRLTLGLQVLEALPLTEQPGVSPSQIDAVASTDGPVPAFVYQEVAHDDDRDRPPEEGGYGALVDDRPRIRPRLTGPCAGRYAAFDGSERVMSGPSAVAFHPASGLTWVAHRFTDNVAVLDCDGWDGDGLAPLRAVFAVGRGPRGLALTRDGQTAFVDEGFAHAVSRLSLPAEPVRGAFVAPSATVRRRLGDTHLSALAREGRSLFHDATNIQLTPSGVVTCATCHPRAQEDGLTWFIHTEGVSRRVRRTQPAWGGGEALLPAHWDGEFETAETLALSTLRELMDGQGLLVDTSAIAAYLTESRPPLRRRRRSEAADAGRLLFEREDVGCARCHAGAWLTDGLRHDTPPRAADPDAQLVFATTPPLRGVRARAPYLHDGRAATLLDVLVTHNPDDTHGRTSALSAVEVDQLVAYLESL
jgi:DNA-binding beta-propeller fold protein YncE